VFHCTTTCCQPGISRGLVDTVDKVMTQRNNGVCRVTSTTKILVLNGLIEDELNEAVYSEAMPGKNQEVLLYLSTPELL
jgi:hypothetical protein